MAKLTDRVVLVTGAASGIGRAGALCMAAEGAIVMCADLNEKGAAETSAMIAEQGGRTGSIALNVTDESAVQAVLQKTMSEFGGLHVLFNNAGVAPAPGMTWEKVIEVNLTGASYGLRHTAPLLAENGGGAIINTSSIAGLVAVASGLSAEEKPDPVAEAAATAYVASKHAVIGLTKQYSVMYASKGVRVNAIAPGYIETAMTAGVKEVDEIREPLVALHPVGRAGQAEEVGAVAAFLASDDASFIHGVVLPVDGGYTAR